MADLGLTKAIRKGVKSSKAVRPVEPEVKKLPVDEIDPTAPVGPVADNAVVPGVADVPPVFDVDERARSMSKASLGDFDLDETYQTNFDVITTTDEVKAVIAQAAERNASRIDVARRGVIANEQLKALAGELNTSTDIIKAVMERESGGVLNPEQILGARQVLHASAARLQTLGTKIATGGATDIERLQFRRQVLFHEDYQTQFMGARAEAGRSLNTFGIPLGDDMTPQKLALMKQTVESMYGKNTDELARMLSQIDSVEGITKFVKESPASIANGTLRELFINSLLSGPKTAVVNLGGSAFQIMNIAERAMAAKMGRITKGGSRDGEATAMVYGMLSGWKDALRLAGKSFKAGKSLDSISRMDQIDTRYITAQRYNIQNPTLAAAVDALGVAIRAPTERLMIPSDEFMKAIAYRSELSRLAYREAAAQAELMEGADLSALIQQFMDAPPKSFVNQAEDYARYVTFQNPLGEAGAAVSKAVAKTNAWILAPFIKTPVNIFKAAWSERSPLGIFSRQTREAIASGGPERDLAIARLSMGTLSVGSVAMAAVGGYITGGGPSNPQARSNLMATGWQPYSIRYTDLNGDIRYQSYARLEPLAYVIGATADAVEILSTIGPDAEDLRSEEEQVNSMIAAVVGGVANNTMSKTFMQGMADFAEMLSDPTRYASDYLENLGGAIIPYSAFRRQFNQIQDPLIREAWTLREKLAVSSGIPGWSQDAPPKRDIFGEPVERSGGLILGAMSPFPNRAEKVDPILAEIVALQDETGTVPITMPGRRIEGMKLTAPEYSELVAIARSEPILGEKTFREALEERMEMDAYLLGTPDFKAAMLKKVQMDYDEAGRRELAERNPDVALKVADFRLRKQGVMYGDLLTPE